MPPQPIAHPYAPTMHHAQHPTAQHHPAYTTSSFMPQATQSHPIKSEPNDSHFSNTTQPYLPPPLPGPQINGVSRPGASSVPPSSGGYTTTLPPLSRPSYPPQSQSGSSAPNGHNAPRMPQLDGPSSSSSSSPSPPPSHNYAPRPSHPSLPQPVSKDTRAVADSEEINSELDDSDSEAEEDEQEGVIGDADIVFCTYDKVRDVLDVRASIFVTHIRACRLPESRTSGNVF